MIGFAALLTGAGFAAAILLNGTQGSTVSAILFALILVILTIKLWQEFFRARKAARRAAEARPRTEYRMRGRE